MKHDKIVMIHGAWAAGWVWDKLTPLLAAEGFACTAVDLPGSREVPPPSVGLGDYVDHVCSVIDRVGEPVWLLSHSGGGAVAAQVAEERPEMVLGVVFIAGMMLPSGVTFADLFALAPEPIGNDEIRPHLVWNEDGTASRVPPDAARRFFFQLANGVDAEAAAGRVGWQPVSGLDLRPALTPARFGSLPRLYVEATEDRSVTIGAQRLMQRLSPGAEIVSLVSDHAPMLSQPETLMEALLPFLRHNRQQPV